MGGWMPVQGTSGCSDRQLPGSKIVHFIQLSSKQGFAQQRLVDRGCACASCGAEMWHLGQLPKPLLQFSSVKQRLLNFYFITPSSTCRLPLGFGRCSTNIELKDILWTEHAEAACFYFQLAFIFSSDLAQVVLGNFWVQRIVHRGKYTRVQKHSQDCTTRLISKPLLRTKLAKKGRPFPAM